MVIICCSYTVNYGKFSIVLCCNCRFKTKYNIRSGQRIPSCIMNVIIKLYIISFRIYLIPALCKNSICNAVFSGKQILISSKKNSNTTHRHSGPRSHIFRICHNSYCNRIGFTFFGCKSSCSSECKCCHHTCCKDKCDISFSHDILPFFTDIFIIFSFTFLL